MNKKILIIASIALILIAGGVWAYALIFAPSAGSGVFANFGAGGDAASVAPTTEDSSDGDTQDFNGEITLSKLHQLTTNAVAGAVFADGGILYVEQGTGHIQFLDLASSTETLVSGTTIPGAYDAEFSSDGEFVAITTTQDGAAKTVVGSVPAVGGSGALDGVALPLGASEVDLATKTGIAYYMLRTSGGARGFAYSMSKKTSTEIFTIPVRDVHVLWGDPLYVYTTPSTLTEGYLYKVVGNELRYVTEGGIGLTAFRYDDGIVVTRKDNNRYLSSLVSNSKEVPLNGADALIPEKCIASGSDLFCGASGAVGLTPDFPDAWYKGAITFSDILWHINTGFNSVSGLSDFFAESGRQIDVLKIGIDSLGTRLWFINKNDNVLWTYQLD